MAQKENSTFAERNKRLMEQLTEQTEQGGQTIAPESGGSYN